MAFRKVLATVCWAIAIGTFAVGAASADEQAETERLNRRLAAKEGRLRLPLPGTPDTEAPLSRLAAAGVSLGARVLIRIFKEESELELWVEKGRTYVKFATYPICFWSGKLGPKLREGDRQTPEGFYTITAEQMHFGDRWQRSLDIGFPNAFDRENGRTGSVILVHGGCDSSGCFAMTNPVSLELYDLVSASLRTGMRHVPVHIFPFRMSEQNMAAHEAGPWSEFWGDLRKGYNSFERTHLPPRISVCRKRYQVDDWAPGQVEAQAIGLCQEETAADASAMAGAPDPLDSR